MHRLLTHATLTQLNDRKTQRHRSRAVWEAPQDTHLHHFTSLSFLISEGALANDPQFSTEISFFALWETLILQWSGKHSSWHPYISRYRTCDSWTTISDGLHSPHCDGGRRRNARSIKGCKKQHIPELCTGAKISEAPQIVAGSLRAKV